MQGVKLATSLPIGSPVSCAGSRAGTLVGVQLGGGDITHVIVRRKWPSSKSLRVPANYVLRLIDGGLGLSVAPKELAALPEYRRDEDVLGDVIRALNSVEPLRALSQVAKMDLRVKDGLVWLRGSLSSSTHKWMAEAATRRVRGVIEVINETLSDQEIENDIAQALSQNVTTKHARVHVRSFNGAVRLRAVRAGRDEMEAAGLIAADRPGVTRVDSRISGSYVGGYFE